MWSRAWFVTKKRMYKSEITRIAAMGRNNPVEATERKGVTSK